MRLEHILVLGGKDSEIGRIAEAFYEHPADGKPLEDYAKFLPVRTGEDAKANIRALEKSSPRAVYENMLLYKKSIEGELVKVVEENLDELVKGENSILVALALEGITAEERAIETKLAKGDVDGVKKLYIELYGKNPAVKHFAEEIADNKFFTSYYPSAINEKKDRFLSNYTGTPDEKGKAEIDEGKLEEYIQTKLASLDDKSKPKAYLEIGRAVYFEFERLQKRIAAKKKAEEKAKAK